MKQKLDMSIVCCYNDKEKLESQLMKGYKIQDSECELCLIDNSNHRFRSAAEALNYGVSITKGKYLIFMHQDLEFMAADQISKIYKILNEHADWIVGAAGRDAKHGRIISWMLEENKNGFYRHNPRKIKKEITKVESLDECFIALSRDMFERKRFDEKNCGNWHLYGVDLCLSCRTVGAEVYVIPMDVCHHSGGNRDEAYYITLEKLMRKHRKNYRYIHTTCVNNVNTRLPLRVFREKEKIMRPAYRLWAILHEK